MNHQCPYCSGKILRHVSSNRLYWYCTSCHQKVPLLKERQPINAIAQKPHKIAHFQA